MVWRSRLCRPIHAAAVLLSCVRCAAAAPADEPAAEVRGFLERYCLECHSGDGSEGERDFASLGFSSNTSPQDALSRQILLQEAVDQLTLSTMPPPEADQPEESEKVQALTAMRSVLGVWREGETAREQHLVLRPLAVREYRYSLGDLLGLNLTIFDPTSRFPAANRVSGFDNDAAANSLSPVVLEEALAAADVAVEKAVKQLDAVPQQQWSFDKNFDQQPELRRAHSEFQFRFMGLYDHPYAEKPEGAYGPLPGFRQGVPADGIYRVRVLAVGMHRDSPYSFKAMKIDLSERFRLGIRPGDTRIDDQVHQQPIQPLLAQAYVPEDEPGWLEFEIPLDQGFAPRFTFENGHYDVRDTFGRLFRFDRELLPEEIRGAKGIVDQRATIINQGRLPHIRIHRIEIEGPLPPDGEHQLRRYFLNWPYADADAAGVLERFASAAYRRPVTAAEVERLTAIYTMRKVDGQDPLAAVCDAMKAVLCSPEFLYLPAPQCEVDTTPDPWHLASRLSYLLRSSVPDQQLVDAAGSGAITKPAELRRQAERLMALPDFERFVDSFVDNWLGLDRLGSMPPDAKAFWTYYARGLQDDIREETRRFVHQAIETNTPAIELLTSQETLLNRDLAKLYGVAWNESLEQPDLWQQHRFADGVRGGLLGHASVLTVSANGIETSPVIRGVWVLEHLLRTPPPPPPDSVPAIDPDIRGATTIREQLEKHRSDAACNVCHRNIDPYGFALERFDAIGGRRERYDHQTSGQIDAGAELADGKHIDDIHGLREALADRQEFFERGLVSSLLAYSLGRQLRPSDRPAVDAILKQTALSKHGVRDLILAVVESPAFRLP